MKLFFLLLRLLQRRASYIIIMIFTVKFVYAKQQFRLKILFDFQDYH